MSGHITSQDEYDGHPKTRIENASHGGYRAGFEAGQASANKTIAELQAQVAALKATVGQCRASGFINDAGNVRKAVKQ